MTRRKNRKQKPYTNPDHRPMIPEFRGPQDTLDTAVRSVRRRYEELNPDERINWR